MINPLLAGTFDKGESFLNYMRDLESVKQEDLQAQARRHSGKLWGLGYSADDIAALDQYLAEQKLSEQIKAVGAVFGDNSMGKAMAAKIVEAFNVLSEMEF